MFVSEDVEKEKNFNMYGVGLHKSPAVRLACTTRLGHIQKMVHHNVALNHPDQDMTDLTIG